MTMELLNQQGNEVSPESREALLWLEKKGKKSLGGEELMKNTSETEEKK